MSRKPFFRQFDGWWYAQIRMGKKRQQVKLVKGKENEKEAYRLFCRLMAEHDGKLPEPVQLQVSTIADFFLDHSQKHNKPRTYEWYKGYLQDFCDQFGALCVLDVRPFHVHRWLDQHQGWGTGSRRCGIVSVKRAFHFAYTEGILRENPLRALQRPAMNRRERVLTPDERKQILAAIKDQAFRDFVFALQETGCRPSEVARVTARDVDLEASTWTLEEHKTKRHTQRPRTVYLTPAMVELTKRLMTENPDGPFFRCFRGKKIDADKYDRRVTGVKQPWTPNAIRCRFRALRRKLPHLKGVVSYTYRHTYATDALENGVGLVQVAELLGHTSTEMVMRHYQHLSEKREHMRQAAIKATMPRAS